MRERRQGYSADFARFHASRFPSLLESLQLEHWAGRAVRSGKSGYIPGSAPPILKRGIDPQQHLSTMSRGGNRFGAAIGCVDSLKRAERLRQRLFLPDRSRIERVHVICPGYP